MKLVLTFKLDLNYASYLHLNLKASFDMDTKPRKSVCRVCLSVDKKNMSLFQEHKSIPIYLHINSLTNVCIKEDDGFPDIICTSCLLDLDTAISFKEKCESSDLFLRTPPSQSTDDNDFKYINVKKEEPQDETEHHEVSLNYSEPDSCHDDCDEEDKPLIEYDNYKPLEKKTQNNLNGKEKVTNFSRSDSIICENSDKTNVKEDDGPKKDLNMVELGLKNGRAIGLQLQCDDCKGYFKSKCKLRVHWKKVHLIEALKCHRCKRTFKSYKSFSNHKQNPTRNCIGAENIRIEIEGKKRMFYCKECDYKSVRINDLLTHWTVHSGDRPYKCDVCSKSFSQLTSLLGHRNTHPQYKKQVPCPHCGKLYNKANLYRHIKTHDKNTKVPCPICQKNYRNKANLKMHMARHSGVKSHTCEICAKTFYTGSELSNHKRTTHFKMRYNYNCNMCNYKFHTSAAMHQHKAKHNNPTYKRCDLCGKFFQKIDSLKLHIKRHSEKKKYSCPYCDAEFHHRNSKRAHILRHHSFLSGETEKKLNVKQELIFH